MGGEEGEGGGLVREWREYEWEEKKLKLLNIIIFHTGTYIIKISFAEK